MAVRIPWGLRRDLIHPALSRRNRHAQAGNDCQRNAAGCAGGDRLWAGPYVFDPQFSDREHRAGASLHKTTCTVCHGATGLGVPGVYLPLISATSSIRLKGLNPTQNQLAQFIYKCMPKRNPGSLT